MDDISSRKQKKKLYLDGTSKNEKHRMHIRYVLSDAQEMMRRHKSGELVSTLLSRGTRTQAFFTSDSHRYITQEEQRSMLAGVRRHARTGWFDSVQMRYSRPTRSASELLYGRLRERYSSIRETLIYFPDMLRAHISPVRVWNASIVGAIFFGMFSMTLIYRYFGQQVSAESNTKTFIAQIPSTESEAPFVSAAPAVLGATDDASDKAITPAKKEKAPLDPIIARKDAEQKAFITEVTQMVKGYPIEAMLPYIFQQDRDVATFLISIGKKESNWGKRVPTLHGKDCFNYWGYRGIRDTMGTGGHTCFYSPEDAVTTVAKRIKTLVQEEKLGTPSKMIVWKCGSSCAGHSPEGVRKWISDVDLYVQELK